MKLGKYTEWRQCGQSQKIVAYSKAARPAGSALANPLGIEIYLIFIIAKVMQQKLSQMNFKKVSEGFQAKRKGPLNPEISKVVMYIQVIRLKECL